MTTAARASADVGLIGLAVMGENLALSMADHGYRVAVYNRTTAVMEKFVAGHPDTPGGLMGAAALPDLVAALKKPRKILILVKAGPPVDAVVEQLLGTGVEPDDIVVDCGNSLWTDTIRRERQYAGRCRFFGSGVSGGEVGARYGPSLMPGGHPASWEHLRPIWEAIAAKVDPRTGKPLEDWAPGKPVTGGEPCTAYIGPNGAGHYVKMVHNGIEYIDMQLISEAYHLLTELGGMAPDRLSEIFGEWNQNELGSYLIEITADILKQRDPARPTRFLVDMVLDAAGQKGTGKWTSVNALAAVIPANAIAAAAQSAMLPLVVFALFFGFALTRIDGERKARMLDFVQAIADVMIVIVRWVLWAAPLGVFALVLAVCAKVGVGMLGALAWYILMQCALYISVTLMLYLVARLFGGEPFKRFALAILPAQTIAASTQSSLASLPAMLESARVRLGYPLQITSLVLPMAVSLFRITSPIQYLGVAAFVAWIYGIDLTTADYAAGIGLAVIVSMGSVGLPGQVSFMATNMPVTQAMGLPIEPLGVLLAVDTIPDVFSTVGNVSADLTATSVVAKRDSGGLQEPVAEPVAPPATTGRDIAT